MRVYSNWPLPPPPPLSEGWFKALLDAQIDMIDLTPADPDWNPNPSSTLMVGYDDLNRTEPDSWYLTYYYWNLVDGRNMHYAESYISGSGSSETILRLELTEYTRPRQLTRNSPTILAPMKPFTEHL
jgi:hypothetical protein